ncbi:unnamed protein product [Dibothriocephalus latus]|uniref:Uncharacterized protein n=1 Tax=Dibothriocephalus latus TaxID=60516 RepID=A0A3P7NYG8_DIBLA|nr:unnamed protein product [Dibothriocephalus latus]
MTRLTGPGGSHIDRHRSSSGSTPTTVGIVTSSLHPKRAVSLASPLTLPATSPQPSFVAPSATSKNLQEVEKDTFTREVAFHLNWFLEMLPSVLQQQFAYERPEVVDGNQLSHSRFFLVFLAQVPASSSPSCLETSPAADRAYLDDQLFGLTEDTELVHWVRSHPQDWEVSKDFFHTPVVWLV